MTVIKQQDFIDSIYDALQYISYYHPVDFVRALRKAYEREQNPAAKNAIAQILVNSKMCAIGHRPLCQDTGIVTCFVRLGMNVTFDGDMTIEEMVNEGTRRAYCCADNPLRKSVLVDPIGARVNTKDNTPAITHISTIPGDKVEILIASKGGGSENKSKLVMLN
ncbi:MAG: fumarate hydratase, partial [Ruminobacter sp.]|nr:fumarate hydratase [Ruminobacter sp.]